MPHTLERGSRQTVVNGYGLGELSQTNMFKRLAEARKMNNRAHVDILTVALRELRRKHQQKTLVNSPDNRRPSWRTAKKKTYVRALMERTAPTTLLVRAALRNDDEQEQWEIYDGANRCEALMQFLNNEFTAPIPVPYPHSASFDFQSLPTKEQNFILDVPFKVTVLKGTSREHACTCAGQLNEGTPLSTGEKLSFIRRRGTARAVAFDAIVCSSPFLTSDGDRAIGTHQVASLLYQLEKHPKKCKWSDVHFEKGVRALFEDEAPFEHVEVDKLIQAYAALNEACTVAVSPTATEPQAAQAEAEPVAAAASGSHETLHLAEEAPQEPPRQLRPEIQQELVKCSASTSKMSYLGAACKALMMAHMHGCAEVTFESLYDCLKHVVSLKKCSTSAVQSAIENVLFVHEQ